MTNLRVPTNGSDEIVGELVRNAVSGRVDRVLDGASAPTRPLVVRGNLRRRRLVVPVLAVLSAAGLTGGVVHQLAQRPAPSPVDVVVRTDASSDESRMVLRAPGLAPVQYASSEMMSLPGGRPDTIHLRDGSTSFDVSIVTRGSRFTFPDGVTVRSVAIGSVTGSLAQFDRTWALDWTTGGVSLRGSGRSVPNQATFDVLAAVGATSSKNLSTVGPFPHGFTATLVEPQVGGYQIGYRKDSSEHGADYYLSVVPNMRFAEDYRGGQKTVQRDGRTYSIDSFNLPGQDLGATVSFEIGEVNILLSGPGKPAAVLALAEQVVVATPDEWTKILALGTSFGAPNPPPPLLIGDVDGTPYSLVASKASSGSCPKVVLRAEGTTLDACLASNEPSLFQVLSATVVNGRTVVFGVDAIRPAGSGENHVIRIVDAAGDVVAEDVTIDQDLIDGRAFALDIPTDAVAPLTAELYDFDRAWYADADPEPESFVRPNAPLLETHEVPAPAGRAAV